MLVIIMLSSHSALTVDNKNYSSDEIEVTEHTSPGTLGCTLSECSATRHRTIQRKSGTEMDCSR